MRFAIDRLIDRFDIIFLILFDVKIENSNSLTKIPIQDWNYIVTGNQCKARMLLVIGFQAGIGINSRDSQKMSIK